MSWNRVVLDTVPECAAFTVYRIGMQLCIIVLILWIPCKMKRGEILEKLSCVASQDQHCSIELAVRPQLFRVALLVIWHLVIEILTLVN